MSASEAGTATADGRRSAVLRNAASALFVADPKPLPLDRNRVQAMVVVRWVATLVALGQVFTYNPSAYPTGVRLVGAAMALTLAGMNVVTYLRIDRTDDLRQLATVGLVADVVAAGTLAVVFSFDPTASVWLAFFVLPIQAALAHGLRGAAAAWSASVVLYVTRDLYAEAVYDVTVPTLEAARLGTLRLGMLLVITMAVGLLAHNLEQHASALRDMVERLEETDQWRAGIIAMLAHDIRSPLGGAASTMKLLSSRAQDLPTDTISQLAAGAARQNHRVIRLANDLLDVAGSEEGRLVLHRDNVDLAEVATEEVELCRDPNMVTVSGQATAHVDPQRVGQIMANLVGNALTHGTPPVELTVADLPGGGTAVTVVDHGDGVPDDMRDRLFTRFGGNKSAGSTGLGLWVVRQLARAHGGDTRYDHDRQGRPRFTVTLPGRQPTASSDTAEQPTNATAG